jgi:hypothetical protein
MNRVAVFGLAVALSAAAFVSASLAADPPPDPPADRVVAIYFHRTQRCPTCQTMGGYAEEAVKQGFAEQVENGSVAFHYIDFQDEKNAALTKCYQIDGPALILVKVVDNKVEEYKELHEIWVKVRKKPEFLAYVRENVKAYLK